MRETLLRVSRREQGASIQQFREGMGLMARWVFAGLFGLLVAGLLPGVALAGGCPNEQFRTGLSADLPDCRAYEMVSPPDKNGGAITGKIWRSSLDGTRMAYDSAQAFADSQAGATLFDEYVASRGAGGWSTHALIPPLAAQGTSSSESAIEVFSSDLSSYVMRLGADDGQDDPLLVSGEPPETTNMFVRATDTGVSQLVDLTPAGVTLPRLGPTFERATPDLSHICFNERAKLTSNAPATPEIWNVYEWSAGVVRLISVLPGGEPVEHGYPECRFISEDGSRVVLEDGNNKLYLREGGVSKVQIDASQGPGLGGGGTFQAASSDGSRIFFTALAARGLTGDTPTGGSPATNVNLYEYDVVGGRLTDLTANSEADVQGVLGAGSSGSYLYFVAEGTLAGGAAAGKANLYVWHEGVTSFIATLEEGLGNDRPDWSLALAQEEAFNFLTSRVTPDGTRVAFESVSSLTGYDNRDASTGERDHEVFLYDAVTGRLVCASCNPSGARPIGSSVIGRRSGEGERFDGGFTEPPRWLSDDGRLFFESHDAVVPQDVNGQEDVYEYESGSVRLISSGTSGQRSRFAEASASGNDVFFVTMQQLVGQDIDQSYDLYDARVDGGFPAPISPVACAGEGCRGVPAGAPVLGVPGSATFSGSGNLAAPATVPVVSAPKAKKPKRKVKHRRRKRVKGKGRARGARGVRSTGKRG